METANLDVQTIERLVRGIVKEVFQSRASAVPPFSGIRTVEKRVSAPKFAPKNAVKPSDSASDSASDSVSGSISASEQNKERKTELKPDELLLDRHIVTLRDVEHLPPAVKRVIVPQNAILTPAVRDELDVQHVRLARYSQEKLAEFQSGPVKTRAGLPPRGVLEVYALFTPYHPESLFPVWERSGLHPNLRSGGDSFEAVRASIAQNETLSVLFTSKVDEALCRLHREEKIRAVHAVNPEKLVEQWKNFSGINTLVVNPSETGIYMAGRLVQTAVELYEKSL